MKNEIGKLGNTDYDVIESSALKITKEKSKDIRVLSFLSLVYLKKDAWEQFADIFDGLATLSEQNYDALYPDRERAKQLAFKWLSEDRYTGLIVDKKLTEADYDHALRLVNALTKIKTILEQKFPEGSPFPSELFKTAQSWERLTKPKPKAPPPPTPAPQAAAEQPAITPVSQTPAAAPQSSTAPVSNEPLDNPKQVQTSIRKMAAFLIEKEPLKAMGYRLMRSARWDVLEKTPPSESGKTQLAGPQPQQRTYFQNLLAQKEWKTALEKAEQAFVAGANHLWLDLQRIIVTSCKEMGDQYSQVKNAVLIETAILLKRIPDLVSMSFSDGSSFCDDATKDWISSEVNACLSGGAAAGTAGPADAVSEEQKKVNALTAANQLEEAMDLVQKGIRSSNNGRDNFRRSVIIGSLLLKAKQPDIAISVLEQLDQKVSESQIEHWEPDLAVEAWSVLVQAYKVSKAQKPQNIQISIQEKQNTILSKISQIDPRKAFILNK